MLIKSEVHVAVDVLQNTDFDPAAIKNRRLVWTFSFEAAGSKAEGSISYHVSLKD